mmetsp:Transcript_24958/g.78681  ORF Transcript_24958/g.78681 Transcript_24958/m.78681 type:complete len:107 (+) Transcript_24958:258-578(+)
MAESTNAFSPISCLNNDTRLDMFLPVLQSQVELQVVESDGTLSSVTLAADAKVSEVLTCLQSSYSREMGESKCSFPAKMDGQWMRVAEPLGRGASDRHRWCVLPPK